MRYKYHIKMITVMIFIILTFSGCKTDKITIDNMENLLMSQLDWKADDYLASLEKKQEDIITMKNLQYGNFSSKDEDEVLVLFHVSAPHVGGLDRSIAAIYNRDTLKIKSQKSFCADHVNIYFFPSESVYGKDYILYIGNTIYQGIPSYTIGLYEIQDGEWVTRPITDKDLNSTLSYSVTNNTLLNVMEIDYDEYMKPLYQYKYTLYWDGIAGKFIE